ncbi:MAG: WYL domain-containing protein, partial [Pseudomonadales bacterium]|nr:WYL domain-containing protein [Pseudomonadales bacterium]
FGIGRQQASKDINNYLNDVAPGNLLLDRHIKGYVPSESFKPRVTRGTADEYLHLLSRNNELSATFETLPLATANTEVVGVPVRNVEPAVIRAIVKAARQCKRLEVDYVSVHRPDRDGRIIVPHTLVYSGFRWHVRAYCETHQEYRDFVLSRFRGVPIIEDDLNTPNPNVDGDKAWSKRVTVKIKPDPRLSKAQREVVARDYGMQNNVLGIETRAALVHYALMQLQIDDKVLQGKPSAQQIVISNYREIEPWLFH